MMNGLKNDRLLESVIISELNKFYLKYVPQCEYIYHSKYIIMQYKTITVQISSTMKSGTEFKEYEFPKVNEYLEDKWMIKEVIPSTTNQNVGFLYLTYILRKE